MRLTKEQLRDARKRLSEWHAPSDFAAAWDDITAPFVSAEMFTQSAPFLRDAWAAAELAKGRDDVSAVRLVPEPADRPDCELRLKDGRACPYECVEADVAGRERGREYQALAEAGNPIIHEPAETWATPEQARDRLRAMTRKKAENASKLAAKGTPYPPGTGLLVNLNLLGYGSKNAEIIAEFPDAVAPARLWFSEIWVLWKGRAHQV